MKKLSTFALVMVLLLSLALGGCSKQENAQNDSVSVNESEGSEEVIVGLRGVPRDPATEERASADVTDQKAMSGSTGDEASENQDASRKNSF